MRRFVLYRAAETLTLAGRFNSVLAGRVPAIHVVRYRRPKDVDGRPKGSHDGVRQQPASRCFRRLILLVIALAALPSAGITAPTCSSTADQSTYEVLALREQMILLATKCSRDQDYNRGFIMRFQPALQANDRAVQAYFRRLYGGAGQGRKDIFATELVNVMSQEANTQGAEFCGRAGLIIKEMAALRPTDDLAAYAGVKSLAPAGVSMCPVTAAPTRR